MSLVAGLLSSGCGSARAIDRPTPKTGPASYTFASSLTRSTGPTVGRFGDPGVARHYPLSRGEVFAGTFWLENNTDRPRRFAVITLLDYRQVPQGSVGDTASVRVVECGASSSVTMPVRVLPPEGGAHDLAVVAFADPMSPDVSDDYRWRTDALVASPERTSLITTPSGAEPRRESIRAIQAGTGEAIVSQGVALTSIAASQAPLITHVEGGPGEPLELFLQVGNRWDRGRDFAVAVFVDYVQVPLTPGGPIVGNGRVGPVSQVAVPLKIATPETSGVHEIVAILAWDPYVDRSRLPADLPDECVRSSCRTALVVSASR